MTERERRTGDPELDRIMTEFRANSQEYADVMAGIGDVVGQAASRDDKIRVRVSSSGQLVGLHLDPRVMRMSSHELAETIMDLSRQATEDAARRVMELTRPYLDIDGR
ncbi:YbaB/EbfC family nucleoid-associated protein [Nonomuraea fuscirosea]|uniref:YbaB/EbfC family nucleoid-associated protein n=1 Tax=Nonomuraea fuscirosea TaxID=1291556 RepID=UPI00342E97FC